jgi:hypothetical protein
LKFNGLLVCLFAGDQARPLATRTFVGIFVGQQLTGPSEKTNMPLTDTKIRAIKPPSRPMKVFDGGGLHLLVSTSGTKAWRFAYSPDEVTVHGFRTTASVRLNEMGRWNPDAIERQLAHQEENDVRRAYIHSAEFWDERVRMMQVWSDYLDEVRARRKVVDLKTA